MCVCLYAMCVLCVFVLGGVCMSCVCGVCVCVGVCVCCVCYVCSMYVGGRSVNAVCGV